MTKYKIIEQGFLEGRNGFEERLNSLAMEGWKAISISKNGVKSVVLLERG